MQSLDQVGRDQIFISVSEDGDIRVWGLDFEKQTNSLNRTISKAKLRSIKGIYCLGVLDGEGTVFLYKINDGSIMKIGTASPPSSASENKKLEIVDFEFYVGDDKILFYTVDREGVIFCYEMKLE